MFALRKQDSSAKLFILFVRPRLFFFSQADRTNIFPHKVQEKEIYAAIALARRRSRSSAMVSYTPRQFQIQFRIMRGGGGGERTLTPLPFGNDTQLLSCPMMNTLLNRVAKVLSIASLICTISKPPSWRSR